MSVNAEVDVLEEATQACLQCQLSPVGAAEQKKLREQGTEEGGLASRLPRYCDYCVAVKSCHHCHITMCSLHLQLHGREEPVRACMLMEAESEAESPIDLPQGESQLAESSGGLRHTQEEEEEEKEEGVEVRAMYVQLKERAGQILQQMEARLHCYGERVMEAIDEELRRSEGCLGPHSWPGDTSLITKADRSAFAQQLQVPWPQAGREKAGLDAGRLCSFLEALNSDLRGGLGEAQRALRVAINPSEVTLDPDTAHPSLLLSEDLKTATFSAVRLPYPPGRPRFTSFLQVLSSQGFSSGRHRWRVQADGCHWVVGVCYQGVARVGLPSALESSPSFWGLMWWDNLLRAYSQGRDAPLKRCTSLRGVEVRLSYEEGTVSFYSTGAPQVHLHTFHIPFTEALHLAVRMMSPQPTARMTLCQ